MAKNPNTGVVVQVDLGLVRPDNRVEYELWYASILDLPRDFIQQMGEYHKPFGKSALFTPRVVTFACETCPKLIRENQCLSNGKYCPYQSATHENAGTYNENMHSTSEVWDEKME